MFKKQLKKIAKKKIVPPSSYATMKHYFPTEQVDIVGKLYIDRKLKPKKKVKNRN